MDKFEALAMMKEGYKVSNQYFGDEEYLHLVNGVVTSEEGYNFTKWFRDAKTEWKQIGWRVRTDLPKTEQNPKVKQPTLRYSPVLEEIGTSSLQQTRPLDIHFISMGRIVKASDELTMTTVKSRDRGVRLVITPDKNLTEDILMSEEQFARLCKLTDRT